tara:strand:- start:1805 stop:2218 length:414 start_codon:yes stop_codon:yes gene_type:complete
MIVYVDVVCDLFHAGHVNFLKQIKAKYPHCILIVGLMSDSQAAAYKRVPIFDIDERFSILSSNRYVDKVIKNAEMPITADFAQLHEIDLVMHGSDISTDDENYWYGEMKYLNKYETLPYSAITSTSEIISKIQRMGL